MDIGTLPWQEIFRPALILAVNLSIATCIQFTALERRHSPLILMVYLILRCLFLNLFAGLLFQDYISSHPFWNNLYAVAITLQALLMWLVFLYTFKGGALKIAVFCMTAEMYTVTLNSGILILINYIEGRNSLLTNSGSLQWTDILIPMIMYGIFLPTYFIFREKIRQGRNMVLKHKKVWAGVLTVYMLAGLMSWWNGYENRMQEGAWIFWLMFALLTVLAAFAAAFSYRAYMKRIETEYRFLKRQREFLALHKSAIDDQIRKMEENQALIDEQMKVIKGLERKDPSGIRVEQYLKKLKEEYNSINAGVFCHDWRIDAILHYYAEIAQKKEIPCSFSFSQYKTGYIRYEVIGELLIILLEKSIKESQNLRKEKRGISLTAGTVKNQLILTLETGSWKHFRFFRLYTYIKKYGGVIKFGKKESKYRMEIMLPCTEYIS